MSAPSAQLPAVKGPPRPPAMKAPDAQELNRRCSIQTLDVMWHELAFLRDRLIHLEQLEDAGILPKPERLARAELERRIHRQAQLVLEWTAQE